MTVSQDARLEALLEDLQVRENVSAAKLQVIKQAILESPYLSSLVDTALDRDILQGFTLKKIVGSGGHFNDDTGRIALDTDALSDAAKRKPGAVDTVTGTLGHEVGHALNQPNRKLGQKRFNDALNAHVGTRLDVHDPTQLALDLQRSQRWDESYAELHSVNAVVSRIRHQNPHAMEEQVRLRVEPTSACVEKNERTNKIEWAPGLEFTPDGRIAYTPQSIEAVARCHFDMPAHIATLGPNRDLDYRNYYAVHTMGVIADRKMTSDNLVNNPLGDPSGIEDAPLHLDMKRLGWDKGLIENGGVGFDKHGMDFQYYDTSTGRPVQRLLRDTSETVETAEKRTGSPDIAPPVAASQAQAPDNPLRLADYGTDVLALQASLIQLNINDRIKTPVQANGIYGVETQHAVEAFQLWHGMDEVNGIADRATREAVQQQAGLAIQQRGVDPSQEQSDQQQARQHQQQRDWQVQQDQRMQEPARLKEEETSREQEQGQDQPPELQPFSDPKHPEHALYADLKQRLEAQGHAFPDDRVNQIVGTLHDERFKPGWRGAVDVENDSVYVTDNARPWARSQTLLQEPAPSIQDTMQAVHTKDMEKAQEQSQSPDPPTQGPTRTR